MVAQTIGRVPLSDVTRSRLTVAALGLAVGLVLSDSSIVILALPEILDRFRVPIDEVSWVLTLFNLVLALVALPAAYLARRRPPGAVCSLGLAVFAAASLGCALAPSFGWLLAARGVQSVGGAAAVCAALELLAVAVGSERTAAGVWAAAGGLGAAAGQAIGGVLTDTISWKAIFVAQVPLALAALALVPHRGRAAEHGGEAAGRPPPAAHPALALLSAAPTATLFLIVLLLINGRGHSPLSAALSAPVVPLSA